MLRFAASRVPGFLSDPPSLISPISVLYGGRYGGYPTGRPTLMTSSLARAAAFLRTPCISLANMSDLPVPLQYGIPAPFIISYSLARTVIDSSTRQYPVPPTAKRRRSGPPLGCRRRTPFTLGKDKLSVQPHHGTVCVMVGTRPTLEAPRCCGAVPLCAPSRSLLRYWRLFGSPGPPPLVGQAARTHGPSQLGRGKTGSLVGWLAYAGMHCCIRALTAEGGQHARLGKKRQFHLAETAHPDERIVPSSIGRTRIPSARVSTVFRGGGGGGFGCTIPGCDTNPPSDWTPIYNSI